MPARLGEPSGNAARIAPRRVVASCRRAGSRVSSRRCAAKTRFWHAGPVRKPPNRGRMPHSQGSMKRDLGFCCKVSTSKMLKSTEGCQKLVFAAHGTTETCRAGRRAAHYRNGAGRAIGVSRPGSRDRYRRTSLRWRTAQMFHVRHSGSRPLVPPIPMPFSSTARLPAPSLQTTNRPRRRAPGRRRLDGRS